MTMRGIGSQNSSLQRMLVGAEPVDAADAADMQTAAAAAAALQAAMQAGPGPRISDAVTVSPRTTPADHFAPLRDLIRSTATSMLHDDAFVEQIAQAALHSLAQAGVIDQAYAGEAPKDQQAWLHLKAAARDAFIAELYANQQFIDAVLRRMGSA